MPQLLVRNVREETVVKLKRRAKQNGRSVEAEQRAILDDVLTSERRSRVDAWLKRADALRQELEGRVFTPAEVLIRESDEPNGHRRVGDLEMGAAGAG